MKSLWLIALKFLQRSALAVRFLRLTVKRPPNGLHTKKWRILTSVFMNSPQKRYRESETIRFKVSETRRKRRAKQRPIQTDPLPTSVAGERRPGCSGGSTSRG